MTISDIINKVYFLTGTSSSSFPAADMLISVNNAYERVVSLIMQTDGRWEWDDTNQTDLPIATTTVTINQQDYSLAITHLEIYRVEMKYTDGLWRELTPLDMKDFDGVAQGEFMKTAGIPEYYDKLGSSVFLYPPPNFTQSASLKLFFKRPPALYTSAEVTTGTKAPGFNSLYHNLISLWATHDYFIAKGLSNRLPAIQLEIERQEQQLMSDYQTRNKDEQLQLKTVYNNPR